MDDKQFEQEIACIAPSYVVKEFKHILGLIPAKLRDQFILLIKGGCNMAETLQQIVKQTGRGHKHLAELVHQRMQDNMSEIMD